MWQKHLPLTMFAYNKFNSPNLANYSPNELVFGRKLKLLLDLETNPDIKVSGTFKDYYILINITFMSICLPDYVCFLCSIDFYKHCTYVNKATNPYFICMYKARLSVFSPINSNLIGMFK